MPCVTAVSWRSSPRKGVLNSTKTSVRNELFSQANLVSAIRLPNNLFTDNAGDGGGQRPDCPAKEQRKER